MAKYLIEWFFEGGGADYTVGDKLFKKMAIENYSGRRYPGEVGIRITKIKTVYKSGKLGGQRITVDTNEVE